MVLIILHNSIHLHFFNSRIEKIKKEARMED